MSENRIFQAAIKLAQEAIQLDREKKADEAVDKYIQSAEALNDFAKFCKNSKLKALAQSKASDYVKRATILSETRTKKHKLRETGGTKKDSHKKSGSKGNDDDSDDEEMSEDELELRKQIDGTIISELPSITWDDVAGLEKPKQALREAIVLPMKHPELFQGARKPWRGILLYGPPGCGKTLIAKAAANECQVKFFAADSASLMSKWLGESEKLLKTMFQVANLDAPSIIFFDEIDSMAGKRGAKSEGGGERRMKTQLLQEMQGVKSKNDKIVTVMAATNLPWEIDSAILRRFEKKIYVGPPTADGRTKIFELCSKGVDKDPDLDFEELGRISEGYSGSDIASVCREVVMLPVRELDKTGALTDEATDIKVRPITLDDFKMVLETIKPVVSEEEIEEFRKWMDEFGG